MCSKIVCNLLFEFGNAFYVFLLLWYHISGQEDETIKSYGDIKITPFNLKEEMEEGHFDAEGRKSFNLSFQ